VICQDILVNCNLNFTEIKKVISQILSINPSEILVVEEIPEEPISNLIRVLCQAQDVYGDFQQLISVYVKDSSLSALLNTEALGRFCEASKCICLISDDSVNPYSMTLIKGIGDYQTAYLSPEFLEEEKYVLS